MACLMNSRNQRRNALNTMRKFNKAYDLPNPASWQEGLSEDLKKAFKNLKSLFDSRKGGPSRVGQGFYG